MSESSKIIKENTIEEVKYHKIDIKECCIDSVIIYKNCAEVTRIYELKKELSGENCFTFENVCTYADTDSLRVEGLGKGTINEVNCENVYFKNEVNDREKDELEVLNKSLYDANLKKTMLHSLKTSNDNVSKFLNDALKKYSMKTDEKDVLISKDVVGGMTNLVSYYEDKSRQVFNNTNEIVVEQKELSEIIVMYKQKIHTFSDQGNRYKTILTVMVDLEATPRTESTFLRISYIVNNAGWTPRYSIRINDGIMKIFYDADVHQSTGEDWNNIKLKLSTSTPSLGAKVPKLPTKYLTIKKNHISFGMLRSGPMCKSAAPQMACSMQQQSNNYEDMDEMEEMCVPTAEVEKNTVNETFIIQRKYTIESISTKSHKVAISIIDLKPTLVYAAVPRLSSMVYLQAKVKNTSDFTLLPGPCNIFMDNNFIAKNQLQMVSPEEEFRCDLGTDDAIKILHIPSEKYKGEQGYISKTTQLSYLEEIEVTNNHKDSVNIKIIEQLPKSKNEKIKVKVIEPNLKTDNTATLNNDNNIEWELIVNAYKKIKLQLRYTVEYPNNEEISEYIM